MGTPKVLAQLRRPDRLGTDEDHMLTAAARTSFQTPAFARAFARAGPGVRILVVTTNDRPIGHALIGEQRALGFRRWEGLCEPAVHDADAGHEVWQALIDAARRRGVVSASWRDATLVRMGEADMGWARDAVSARGGALRSAPCGTYSIDLTVKAETLWDGLDKRHRNVIRRARRDGVTTARAEDADAFRSYVALSAATWRDQPGEGPSPSFLEALRAEGSAGGWLRTYLAMDANDEPVAGAMVTIHGGRACYLLGAAVRTVPGASALVQWRIMDELADEGITAYDMGGVEVPGGPADDPRQRGIRRFKRRFGGAWEVWPRAHLTVRPRAYRLAGRAVRLAARFGWRP